MRVPSRTKSSRISPERRFDRAGFLLFLASLALAACGGGDSGDSNSATLSWDAVSDPGLSGYRIYYGTAPGTYDQARGSGYEVGATTTFTVTGLAAGRRYYFVATAFDASNNESPYSNEVYKDIP